MTQVSFLYQLAIYIGKEKKKKLKDFHAGYVGSFY